MRLGICVFSFVFKTRLWKNTEENIISNLSSFLQSQVGRVYKTIFAHQRELGVTLTKDVRQHVTVQPMAGQELETVTRWLVEKYLQRAGWWRQNADSLLSLNVLASTTQAGNRTQHCYRVHVEAVSLLSSTTIRIFVRASKWRGADCSWRGWAWSWVVDRGVEEYKKPQVS